MSIEDAVIEHIDGVPRRLKKAIWSWGSARQVKEKRPIWTSVEIINMIKIMKEKNILSLLYGGKYRKNDVFKVVAANLRKFGYTRTAEQIATKWKQLRLTYAHAKAECQPGNPEAKLECAYYDHMDDLLGDKIHIVGVDNSEENVGANQKIEIQSTENLPQVVETEVHMEDGEAEYLPDQVYFSQVEVIQTDETNFSLPGPSGEDEMVMIEVQEANEEQTTEEQATEEQMTEEQLTEEQITEEQQELVHEAPDTDFEAAYVDASPPKQTRKRKMFRNPPGRLKKANEGTYSNALKSFTKEWESMMMRVAERERQQDRVEKEREKSEQRKWEERLIEQQSEAMTKANTEFLIGLKGLFDELKKQ